MDIIIANKIGSYYINNNDYIKVDIANSKYKRLLTLMGYTQIEHIKKYNKKAYKNRLRRDGIIVSVTNFFPNANLDYLDLDNSILEILKYINENFGKLDNDGVDKAHLELLDKFEDPGELKTI